MGAKPSFSRRRSTRRIVATAAEMAPQLQTGSLLLSEGDCLAIRIYTASRFTHVAVVCVEAGEPIVYDSMNGVGVRRLPLAEYLAAESPHEVQIFNPRIALTAEQGRVLEESLRSQLGRPYGVQTSSHRRAGGRNPLCRVCDRRTDVDRPDPRRSTVKRFASQSGHGHHRRRHLHDRPARWNLNRRPSPRSLRRTAATNSGSTRNSARSTAAIRWRGGFCAGRSPRVHLSVPIVTHEVICEV